MSLCVFAAPDHKSPKPKKQIVELASQAYKDKSQVV